MFKVGFFLPLFSSTALYAYSALWEKETLDVLFFLTVIFILASSGILEDSPGIFIDTYLGRYIILSDREELQFMIEECLKDLRFSILISHFWQD